MGTDKCTYSQFALGSAPIHIGQTVHLHCGQRWHNAHHQFTSSKRGWQRIGSPVQDRVTPLHCKSATQLQTSAFEQKVHHLPRGGAFEKALLPEVNAPLRSPSYDYTGAFGPHKSPHSKGALSTEQWTITVKEDKSCSLSQLIMCTSYGSAR